MPFTHVGNIFYAHGLAVITNQDYQSIFPLPPVAINNIVTFSTTSTPKRVFVSSLAEVLFTKGIIIAELVPPSIAPSNNPCNRFCVKINQVIVIKPRVKIKTILF
jgi:hypothetical protein